jgi:hypothetical protein
LPLIAGSRITKIRDDGSTFAVHVINNPAGLRAYTLGIGCKVVASMILPKDSTMMALVEISRERHQRSSGNPRRRPRSAWWRSLRAAGDGRLVERVSVLVAIVFLLLSSVEVGQLLHDALVRR